MNKKIKILIISWFIVLISALPALALERELFNNTEAMPQDSYYGLRAVIEKDNTYHLKVNSTQNIDLLILDEENFLNYNSTFHGNPTAYTAEHLYTNTSLIEFNITQTEDVVRYIVIENANITSNGAISTGEVNVTIVLSLVLTSKVPGYTLIITLSGLLLVSGLLTLRKKRKTL
ncbi:MAG: hypothetical protein K9W45_04045 [Candidatus Heimdallarchaeum aukensis]|uniref:Uncharacterized protein n=1 Tax=Candidatus Heimdallarchaeum aukensis TaxID=2876573 RepID=A0A9Y1BMR1_9ARCH|nr:MAG: hypothetical protein K9W45_04045 [Candidatus Heimdallarchaeum aukensis]